MNELLQALSKMSITETITSLVASVLVAHKAHEIYRNRNTENAKLRGELDHQSHKHLLDVIEVYKSQIADLECDIEELREELRAKEVTIEEYKEREQELKTRIDAIMRAMDLKVREEVARQLAELHERINALENQ